MADRMGLESVPGLDRPMGAGTRDILLSEDELGNQTFRNPTTGVVYTVRRNQDQRTTRRKVLDWWNAGANLPSASQVVDAAKEIPGAVYDSAKRVLRNEGTIGEAAGFAPAMGAASAPFKVPEGSVRIFGGLRSATAPVDRLPLNESSRDFIVNATDRTTSRYPVLEDYLSVADPRDQWEETGWFRGPDDMMRYEIPDTASKVVTSAEMSQLATETGLTVDELLRMTNESSFLSLGDVLDHPTLYEAYPQLESLPVSFNPELKTGEGIFDYRRIHVSPEDLDKPDTLRNVILHETQHWIQEHEGFYGGSNPDAIRESDGIGRVLSEDFWAKKDQITANPDMTWEEKSEATKELLRQYNTEIYNAYQRVYGEDEARAVEGRLNLTPQERTETFPEDSGKMSRAFLPNVSRRPIDPYSNMEIPPRQYAEGGVVPNMDEQMKFAFMAKGGMIDDGKKVEPTTGNKIPPGSLAEEVKDHVSAKLSPGEYVLPADVVQFYGLDKIEKLVGKAKEGLADLESRGRIGGKDEEDDLPFSDEELKSSEDDEDELEFAEGGMVPQTGGMHNRTYVDSQGTEHSVLFMGNMPLGYIDPKWRLKTQQVQEETKAPETSVQAVDDGDSGDSNTEGPKSPSEWTLEDFQKFDPSGNPLGPIGNILGGLGAGGGLISWGINAMREGTVNRAYSELEKRLQDPSLPEEEKASYTEQLARYKTAMENPQTPRTEQSRGLLGNLFGGDGLLGGLFNTDRRPQDRATQTPTTQTRAPAAAPAGLGGGDDNNYAPTTSSRPQARSTAQASPGARGVGGETSPVTTTTGRGRNQRTETKDQSTNPGGFDKESGSWSVGPMAEGGLVARPKGRKKKAC